MERPAGTIRSAATVAFLCLAVLAFSLALAAAPAVAWTWWPYGPSPGWRWPPAPVTAFTVGKASRLYYPPGYPLSVQDGTTGTTYCLSRSTGYYYVCAYSAPADGAAAAPIVPWSFPAAPFAWDEPPPAPSGVLFFRLPAGAEATINGEPVGLSAGEGVAAVAPGVHRLAVRAAGLDLHRTVTVAPRAILTVTPAGISPGEP